ncbi:sodium channel protein Nach [Condylostylus longicornis]|uniref:sodium channel protein Nach n=1 Tax=Condylostylus longicornis TaxID=2530218 RepID=UPI00244DEF44|nr:sodium channel protein Nach [Condylostylus longicornis]
MLRPGSTVDAEDARHRGATLKGSEWKKKSNEDDINYVQLFKRSIVYQTKEFFENSTLHGVRYIAETGRPIGEKFMWFCFTSIGAVAALVIIMSLWEKFQTNPTITGLDTDFHNQQVMFPTTIVCPEEPYDSGKAYQAAYAQIGKYDNDKALIIAPFLEILTKLSFDNLMEAYALSENFSSTVSLNEYSLRSLAFMAAKDCNDTLLKCKYRTEDVACCSHFESVYTEHGFCYGFNSRFKSKDKIDEKSVAVHDLYETDKKWSLQFLLNQTSRIYIFSHEEYFEAGFKHQLVWEKRNEDSILISKKNTYTTDDAKQLSIKQRKCIFPDEVKLSYFKEEYTFSSCMKECRINKAYKLCKCNPPFYKPIADIPMCKLSDFPCLDKYKKNITNIKDCLQCELSCQKTVYNIEKLTKVEGDNSNEVRIEFLTWPIIRYKREVLFGWVDLLVSFGGIAGLFLGFSLLSGVEIIYYFSLRAFCMIYKSRDELHAIENEKLKKPPPKINMSLRLREQTSKSMKEKPLNSSATSGINIKPNIENITTANKTTRRNINKRLEQNKGIIQVRPKDFSSRSSNKMGILPHNRIG